MTFKTAILGSAAAAFMIASPVLAQDAATSAPQTPATQQPAAQEPAAQPSLSLTPGTPVHGPDGELGKLEGVQNNASGAQELTVRGADGQLRAVPLNGVRQDGANVSVDYTKAEFDAAAPIPDAPATAPTSAPSTTSPSSNPPATTMPSTPPVLPTPTTPEPAIPDPADPSGSSDPMAPPPGDQPQG